MTYDELKRRLGIMRAIQLGEYPHSYDLRPIAPMLEDQWITVSHSRGIFTVLLTKRGEATLLAPIPGE